MRRTRSLAAAVLLALATSACSGAARTTTAGAYPCNPAGIATDQPAELCGKVVAVLPARTTRSGRHGYFIVGLSTGRTIRVVSNLDAMAEAPDGAPPAQWPWLAVGDYVYVQGRYYYDNPSSQGIDWTEDHTSRLWPHTGYVAVCDARGAHCALYQ